VRVPDSGLSWPGGSGALLAYGGLAAPPDLPTTGANLGPTRTTEPTSTRPGGTHRRLRPGFPPPSACRRRPAPRHRARGTVTLRHSTIRRLSLVRPRPECGRHGSRGRAGRELGGRRSDRLRAGRRNLPLRPLAHPAGHEHPLGPPDPPDVHGRHRARLPPAVPRLPHHGSRGSRAVVGAAGHLEPAPLGDPLGNGGSDDRLRHRVRGQLVPDEHGRREVGRRVPGLDGCHGDRARLDRGWSAQPRALGPAHRDQPELPHARELGGRVPADPGDHLPGEQLGAAAAGERAACRVPEWPGLPDLERDRRFGAGVPRVPVARSLPGAG